MGDATDETAKAVRAAAAAMAAATGQSLAAAQALVEAELALVSALTQAAGTPAPSPPGEDEADGAFDNMPV